MANKIKLTINGLEYCVVSEDSSEYIRALGEELSDRLSEITSANGFMSASQAATYIALDLLDDCKKTREKLSAAEQSVREAKEEATRANLATREAEREIERLNEELLRIRRPR